MVSVVSEHVNEDDREFAERPHFEAMPAQVDVAARDLAAYLIREIPALVTSEEQLIAGCEANLRAVLGGLESGRFAVPELALQHAKVLGGEAVELSDLLRAYRLSHAWFCRWRPSAIADPRDAYFLFEFFDQASLEVAASFSAERTRRSASSDVRRDALVTSLLTYGSTTPDDDSRNLGYRLERHHVCVVLWTDDSLDAQRRLRAAACSLAEQVRGSERLIREVSGGWIEMWIGTRAPFDVDSLKLSAEFDVCAATGRATAGVAGFRESHQEALEAQRVSLFLGCRPSTLLTYESIELLSLLSVDLPRAQTFMRRELGDLAESDEGTARVRATLKAYLEEGCSRQRTADRLGVHLNTVNYRLRRAEEILGRSVGGRLIGDRRCELQVALVLADCLAEGLTLSSAPDLLLSASVREVAAER